MVFSEIEKRVRAAFAGPEEASTPLFLARSGEIEADLAEAPDTARKWASTAGFRAEAGELLLSPDADGAVGAAFAGLGALGPGVGPRAQIGALPRAGGERVYTLRGAAEDAEAAALEWALGAYRFERYRAAGWTPGRLSVELDAATEARVMAIAEGVYLARDLVNTPAADLSPLELEAAARALAERHGADLKVVEGAALEAGYPMIHAVGRAGPKPPRLLDLTWGAADAPKLTLVGKGVCFDTGGLDLKPSRAMRNMKKDMGGSAAAMALAHMVMALGLGVRLRLLVPAVENSVASDAFRPGDILQSRKGLTVEIDNTDAEGRLVLADALADADAEAPDLMLDFATLTGAARVALGPELPAFFTDDEALAASIAAGGERVADPVWRLPLWRGYARDLNSRVADIVNSAASGFAGSITAALFLDRFVDKTKAWAHFDLFAWNPSAKPGRPEGGECQTARACLAAIEERFSQGGQTGGQG